MKWLSAAFVAALVSLLAAVQWAPDAHASCIQRSAEEHVEGADIILVGTIQAVHDVNRGVEVDVAVERYLKASEAPVLTFRTDLGFSEQEVGQRWLLLLRHDGRQYVDSVCGASWPLDVEPPSGMPSLAEVEAVTGSGTELAQVNPDGLSPAVTVEPGQEDTERASADTSGESTDARLLWTAGAAGVLVLAVLIGLRSVYVRRR